MGADDHLTLHCVDCDELQLFAHRYADRIEPHLRDYELQQWLTLHSTCGRFALLSDHEIDSREGSMVGERERTG